MTNLTLSCFYIGMPINLHSTEKQNKLGGRISKNVAKISTNWLKLAMRPSLARHNLVFDFRPHQNDQLIETSQIVKRYKLYIIPFIFWIFEPLFATCDHIWRADLKVPPGCRNLPRLSPQTHCSKTMSQKNRSPYPP